MQPIKEQTAVSIKHSIKHSIQILNDNGLLDDDTKWWLFEEKLQSELIKLIESQSQIDKHPYDFHEKQEPRIQPTNPHFAKENWRK